MDVSWTIKKVEHWRTDALNHGVAEDSWESPGLQGDPTSPFWRKPTWLFIGRTDAEAEAQLHWSANVKSLLIGKDSDAEKDWRQKEKSMAEDEMVR